MLLTCIREVPYSNLGVDTNYLHRRRRRRDTIILSRVWVTKEVRFGLVIGFINNLQVVTTINYNIVPDFHIKKHSTLISSVYLHYSSRIYNTGSIKVTLNHTLPTSLCHSKHKVFKSLRSLLAISYSNTLEPRN
jgi:hypothetical protein